MNYEITKTKSPRESEESIAGLEDFDEDSVTINNELNGDLSSITQSDMKHYGGHGYNNDSLKTSTDNMLDCGVSSQIQTNTSKSSYLTPWSRNQGNSSSKDLLGLPNEGKTNMN